MIFKDNFLKEYTWNEHIMTERQSTGWSTNRFQKLTKVTSLEVLENAAKIKKSQKLDKKDESLFDNIFGKFDCKID